jgi:hypothetical protein
MDSVVVYPAFDARYYSMYVEGLYRVFGRGGVRFRAEGFPPFGSDCLALRFRGLPGGAERRVYLHSNDYPDLDGDGLAWCEVFGKVNLDPERIPDGLESRVIALGPTFAVRVWGPLRAELVGVANYLRAGRGRAGFRDHMGAYRGQYRSRFPESAYVPASSKDGYVFFNAAVWEREPEAAEIRSRFIDACRSVEGLRFEGGLTPRHSARGDRGFRAIGYEEYVTRRYSPLEHFEKTRMSLVVLNNPAYVGCHSWRLGEGLALGKAIVSTPLVREVPEPLVHGIHIHYVDGSLESFRSAIRLISEDHAYRKTLERNARAYYEAFLSPAGVIGRVMQYALESKGRSKVDAVQGAAT